MSAPKTSTHTLILSFMFLAVTALFITGYVHRSNSVTKKALIESQAKEWPLPQPDTTLTFSKGGHVQNWKVPSGENIEVITDENNYILDVRFISTTGNNGDLGSVPLLPTGKDNKQK